MLKKIFVSALLALASLSANSQVQSYDWQYNRKFTGAFGTDVQFITEPAGRAFMGWDGTSNSSRARFWEIGSGFSVSCTTDTPPVCTISASGSGSIAWTDISGKPSTFAPSAHTHLATDISDSTTTGLLVMKAASAAAARSAIGAGTSSFDGAYTSLSAVPTTFAPAAHNQAWSTITATPTTLAGFGITDALSITTAAANYYPLGSNPAGYLLGINSAQVSAALGFTPYSAANPAGYISSAALAPYLTSASAASTYATTTQLATKFTTPAGTTAQYVRGDGSLATLPTVAARVFANPARTLGTAFQISATRDAQVSYSIGVEVAGLLSVTPVKTVGYLEYADDAAMATNLVLVDTGRSGAGGLINLSNSGSIKLVGGIPAGKYARVRVVNTGAPTVSFDSTQEVQQ